MADEQTDLRKDLMKMDKLKLVKQLKAKNLPTNGARGDMVDRLLAYDEKNGGKMAKKARKATADRNENDGEYDEDDDGSNDDDEDEDDDDYDDDEDEEEPEKKPKPKKKKKKKKQINNSGGGGGGGGAPIDCSCPGQIVFGGASPSGIGQIFTLISALCQLILGIIQFVVLCEGLENICNTDSDVIDCVGESLFWEIPGVDETDDFNQAWRYRAFSLAPSLFFEYWTPQLFAFLACLQLFQSTSWYWISGGWFRCMFFHLIMLLFAAFPYCGKAGIVIGFIHSFTGFICLIMGLLRNGGTTYVQWAY